MIDGGSPQGDFSAGIEKYCYNYNNSYCASDGGLYQWHMAMALPQSCDSSDCSGSINSPHQGICPTGWHIPSDNDWHVLESGLSSGSCVAGRDGFDCDPAGTALEVGGGSGFNAIFAGAIVAGIYDWEGAGTYWWATYNPPGNSADSRSLTFMFTTIANTERNRSQGISVRCLKD